MRKMKIMEINEKNLLDLERRMLNLKYKEII